MEKKPLPLRERVQNKLLGESDTPIIIYIVVVSGILVSLGIKYYHPELSLNLVSEIIGAAFTLFVIDVLLVKTKTRRWKVVQNHIDYLIARNINRIRDGVSTRVFSFKPNISPGTSEAKILPLIRDQRERFLKKMMDLDADSLSKRISEGFFDEENYDYFNEKAEDIWDLINMKYSEFLAPSLVSLLIELHTNLKDTCSHISIYRKSERFPDEKDYYQSAGIKGAGTSLKTIVRIVNKLKEEGYSESARK